MGNALLSIRERKLYKASYNSFRDYLKARWGIGKSQAYRLMEAAEAIVEAENVPQGLAEAENERQAREQISIAKREGKAELALEDVGEDNPKLRKFIAAREKSRARGKDKNEVNFWLNLVFGSHSQKMEFLDRTGVGTLYGMYVDGEILAEKLGIAVTPSPFNAQRSVLECRLKELALESPQKLAETDAHESPDAKA